MPRELRRKRGRRASRRVDGKCHRKHTAPPWLGSPGRGGARVKRWGKSPPRRRQRRRHDKPLPVQGKIGGWTARPIATGMLHSPWFARASHGERDCREAVAREMTTESRASGRNKIRLTGPKANFAGSCTGREAPRDANDREAIRVGHRCLTPRPRSRKGMQAVRWACAGDARRVLPEVDARAGACPCFRGGTRCVVGLRPSASQTSPMGTSGSTFKAWVRLG